MVRHSFVTFFAVALGACAPAEDDVLPPDGDPIELAERDDVTFDRERVIEVVISMEPDDFDALRHQRRDFLTELGGEDCRDAPFQSPYRYFPADIEIDGVRIEEVGIRKKGFIGSQSEDKPGFRINLDEYLDGKDLYGKDNVTLNNSVQDPALIRQCLTYETFRAAGLPAPRCNFAHVWVNDDDLGIYVHVEPVKRQFVRAHFGHDDGDLYEGTVSDFVDGWEETFDPKTFDTDPSLAAIRDVTAALQTRATAEVLEAHFEVDDLLRFLAVETITGHWDGYAGNRNNFFAYRDRGTGKFWFVPWGTDGTMRADQAGQPPFNQGVLASRILADPTLAAQYEATVRTLLDEVWREDELEAEIDRVVALLEDEVDLSDHRGPIEDVRAYVRTRRAGLEATLPGAPSELQPPFCFVETASISATFATTWGSAADPNPVGAGTVDVEIVGVDGPVEFVEVGAIAGISEEGDPFFAIIGVLDPANSSIVVVYVGFDPEAASEPLGIGAFGGGEAEGAVFYSDNTTNGFVSLGFLNDGTLAFDQFSTTEGAPVSGTLETAVYNWGEVEP